jgi:Holliday junction resolvase RusA-like endonuclease
MEQDSSNESVGTEKTEGLDTRVNITVISYRKRRHDPDGVSVKAVLDGLIQRGILEDDSTDQVKEVTFKSCIIGKDEDEKTEVLINSVNKGL